MKRHAAKGAKTVLVMALLAGGATVGGCHTFARRGAAPLTLAEEGRPAAVIVAHGHAAPAEALRAYVEKITGASLPVVTNAAEAPAEAGVVTLDLVERIHGTGDRATARQAYRLRTAAGALRIEAVTEEGLAAAVWGLLEDHCGVLFADPAWEHVPKRPSLRVGPLDETAEPAFVSRRAIDQRDTPWLLKNRGGGAPGLWSNHSFYTWIPPAETFRNHPEWFALIDGERKPHDAMSLCGTNPGLAAELARRLMARMEKSDPREPLRVGQGDGFAACGCDDCRALVEREGSEAAPYLLMLNRALEITAKTYPQHRLATFAYYGTLPAPKTLRPHPNLAVNVVTTGIKGNSDQLGRIRGNPANAACREAYETWSRLAPGRVGAWHWSVNFRALTTEWPNLYAMADNFRFWRDAGLAAAHPEGVGEHSGSAGNWMALRRWLYVKLMWNPDADADALIGAFLRAYYGPEASPLLHDYLRATDRIAAASGLTASGLTDANVLRQRLFNDENLARMTRLLERARDAVRANPEPLFAARVEEVIATSVDVLHLMDAEGRLLPLRPTTDARDGSLWLVPGGAPDAPARIDRIGAAYRSQNIREWADGWFSRLRFLGYVGGPVRRIESDTLLLETVPHLDGEITRLVYKPTGADLLAWDADPRVLLAYRRSGYAFGYGDQAPAAMQEWRVDEDASAARALTMIGDFHRQGWWDAPRHKGSQHLRRTMRLDDTAAALTIERAFVGAALARHLAVCAMPDPTRFGVRWRFAVADAAKAGVRIAAGTNTHAIAFTDKPFEMEMGDGAGELSFAFDRGDGLVVRLTTPARGWEKVTVAPDAGRKQVAVTLGGRPQAMSVEARVIDDLPPLRLEVAPSP